MQNIDISRYLKLNRKFSKLYDTITAKAAVDIGITKPEFDILAFLSNNSEYNTACDIAKYRGFSKAYISKAVDLLLKRGYIDIKINNIDRRFQNLTITDSAQASVKKIQHTQQQFVAKLSYQFTKVEIDSLYKIIDHLINNIDNY